MHSKTLKLIPLIILMLLGLNGCLISTVVGTAVDLGVEVVKVPFKVGKGVYDAVSDDDDEEEDKKKK